MKTNRLTAAILIVTLSAGIISCKKESSSLVASADTESATTLALSGNQAVADNLAEDVNNVFMEAAADKNLLGNCTASQPVVTTNTLTCASISVTPATSFPKTIVIDFGTGGCTSTNGNVHTGKLNIVLTDSVRKTGSKAVVTFTNYTVNNFKIDGTVTWTNTSIPSTRSWERKVDNGKITAPDGSYSLHSGTIDIVQIAGANTPNSLLDDVFLITGNQTVTNAAGKTRNCYITEALQKKTSCDNIGAGKLKVEGASHYATIDFGNGDCDKIATVAIDGQLPQTIQLR